MLSILFGSTTENTNTCPDVYFNNVYEEDWFTDEVVLSIIKDVDNSTVVGLSVVNEHLGSVSVEKLSGGCKTLILLYKENSSFEPNLIWLGQNCADWLVKISKVKDRRAVFTGRDLSFSHEDSLGFLCLNDNSIIANGKDWGMKILKYIVGV